MRVQRLEQRVFAQALAAVVHELHKILRAPVSGAQLVGGEIVPQAPQHRIFRGHSLRPVDQGACRGLSLACNQLRHACVPKHCCGIPIERIEEQAVRR